MMGGRRRAVLPLDQERRPDVDQRIDLHQRRGSGSAAAVIDLDQRRFAELLEIENRLGPAVGSAPSVLPVAASSTTPSRATARTSSGSTARPLTGRPRNRVRAATTRIRTAARAVQIRRRRAWDPAGRGTKTSFLSSPSNPAYPRAARISALESATPHGRVFPRGSRRSRACSAFAFSSPAPPAGGSTVRKPGSAEVAVVLASC